MTVGLSGRTAAHLQVSSETLIITPLLRLLQWVCQRIDFKTLVIVYERQNGLGLKYLSNILHPCGSRLVLVLRVEKKPSAQNFTIILDVYHLTYIPPCFDFFSVVCDAICKAV